MMKESKLDKKIKKKNFKLSQTILLKDNVTISESETQHLVVCNGGLANSVSLDYLMNIFSPFGNIIDITMQPEKSYAFISYSSSLEARCALDAVNGMKVSSSFENVPDFLLVLNFVTTVPGINIPSTEKPPGIVILEEYINSDSEDILLKCIDWNCDNLPNPNQQKLKHRRVKHYGYQFIYGINNVDQTNPLDDKIPDACLTILKRLADDDLISSIPDQLTINEYTPGHGIPPHVDTHSAFEDFIVVISLGSQVVMEFSSENGVCLPILIPRRSVYIMTDECRYAWRHGIPARKSDIVPKLVSFQSDEACATQKKLKLTCEERLTRTSFTFRKVKKSPCNCDFPRYCDSQKFSLKESGTNVTNQYFVPESSEEAIKIEKELVHKVYQTIADDFSGTRHTPWPKVVEFLNSLDVGSFVADVGCGNGKYLGVRSDLSIIGCDRSSYLCDISKSRGFDVFVSDGLAVPLKAGFFDAVISIAVIHHFSTPDRRRDAIVEISKLLKPGGLCLVYVWAFEQERDDRKSKYLKNQIDDSLDNVEKSLFSSKDNENTFEEGSDQKELHIHTNRTKFESQDLLVPWKLKNVSNTEEKMSDNAEKVNESNVYHRFYHVFKENELENMIGTISNLVIRKMYYDQGNWCVIFEKLKF